MRSSNPWKRREKSSRTCKLIASAPKSRLYQRSGFFHIPKSLYNYTSPYPNPLRKLGISVARRTHSTKATRYGACKYFLSRRKSRQKKSNSTRISYGRFLGFKQRFFLGFYLLVRVFTMHLHLGCLSTTGSFRLHRENICAA